MPLLVQCTIRFKMEFNKSQLLIIGTIASAVLGLPDIEKIFSEEIIEIVMQNPSQSIIILVSILKILLIVGSIAWLIQLIRNIEFAYRTKSESVFQRYILTLVITGILAFIAMIFLKRIIGF